MNRKIKNCKKNVVIEQEKEKLKRITWMISVHAKEERKIKDVSK